MDRLTIGTRPSNLSRAQTKIVVDLLSKHHAGLEVRVVAISTRGDRLPPGELGTVDVKAAFTEDIESMLILGKVDAAVHSLKDLPASMDERLIIAATPKREDRRDVLLSNSHKPLSELPQRARIGTSSLRRRIQLRRMRQDLDIVDLHGNVDTRIRRLRGENGFDGIVLAAAGLKRLGVEDEIAQYFSIQEMVPAVGQGILAVQSRESDTEVRRLLSAIDDSEARTEALCERTFLKELGGDCHVPIGASAELSGGLVALVGMVASADGGDVVTRMTRGPPEEAESIGRRLAQELLPVLRGAHVPGEATGRRRDAP